MFWRRHGWCYVQGERVERLHPIRVLLASPDLRFVRVMSFLLGRAGFSVEATWRPTEIIERAERHGADVVVFDGGHAVAKAAWRAAVVGAEVPVIVVVERLASAPSEALCVLPKWGRFDRLVEAIEAICLPAASQG